MAIHAGLMQHISLVAFLSGDLSPEALAHEIAGEVSAHRTELEATKVGRIRISDGPTLVMNKVAAQRFLWAIANRQLTPDMAVYIADCIVASDSIDFADQETRDAVFFIEDDTSRYIEGRDEIWTHEEIMSALASLA